MQNQDTPFSLVSLFFFVVVWWIWELLQINTGHFISNSTEHVISYLQLSTKALASSSFESGKSAVLQSVILKKCFSLPMNVDWSHRWASMSKVLRAMSIRKSSFLSSKPPFSRKSKQLQMKPGENRTNQLYNQLVLFKMFDLFPSPSSIRDCIIPVRWESCIPSSWDAVYLKIT